MLKNIKSEYFIKNIFSFVYKPTIIRIARYNKYFQKIANLNIFDYRLLSGKYIIYKENNKGEEYNSYNDALIYKGEYLKGKRNGQGKEYEYIDYIRKIMLIFEGEYLNGKRNGQGKEYYDGKLIYEGEYLNGKRNGQGKEYYNNRLIFKGEYLNGKQWTGTGYDYDGVAYKLKEGKGFVKEHYGYAGSYSDLKFEGEYLNGERNGKGKEYYHEGKLRFDGEYLNGKRWNGKFYTKDNKQYEVINGSGFIKEDSGVLSDYFQGTYINGEKNGKGYVMDGGYRTLYEGEYKNDKKNGYGKEYNHDYYLVYEGDFLNGEKSGKIKEYFTKDNIELIFDGEYLYNHRRRGKEYKDGILIYEGEYLFDRKWEGKTYNKNKNVIYEIHNGNGKAIEYYGYRMDNKYEGEFLEGKRNGKGKEYLGETLLFEGEYKDGKRNGYGIEYDIIGRIQFKGTYLNGERCINNTIKEKKDEGCILL